MADGPRVTLRQIEYLLTVVEEQSFRRAAERLLVTQSGLSQQIQALERTLGVPLLKRLPRGVRLTAAGQAFVPHGDIALRASQRAFEAVQDVLTGRTGSLEVATVLSMAVGVLPGPIARWSADHPSIRITLLEYAHARLLEKAVQAGAADLAIGPYPRKWPGSVMELGTERFVLIMGRSEGIADRIQPYQSAPPVEASRSRGTLDLAALHDHTWVLLAHDNGLGNLVEGHLRAAGLFEPTIALRTSQFEVAARLSAAGIGVTLLPSNAIPDDLDALVCEPAPPLTRSLAVYARAGFTPLAEHFARFVAAGSGAFAPPEAGAGP